MSNPVHFCPIDKKPCDCLGPCGLLAYAQATGAAITLRDAAVIAPGRREPPAAKPSPPPRPSPQRPPGCTCVQYQHGHPHAFDCGIAPAGHAPPAAPRTCCLMRRKAVLGVLAVLPEAVCGVADAELADFLRFDVRNPGGKPVLAVRYCAWCGALRDPAGEERVTPPPFSKEPS
jgi:hypothetical protein